MQSISTWLLLLILLKRRRRAKGGPTIGAEEEKEEESFERGKASHTHAHTLYRTPAEGEDRYCWDCREWSRQSLIGITFDIIDIFFSLLRYLISLSCLHGRISWDRLQSWHDTHPTTSHSIIMQSGLITCTPENYCLHQGSMNGSWRENWMQKEMGPWAYFHTPLGRSADNVQTFVNNERARWCKRDIVKTI